MSPLGECVNYCKKNIPNMPFDMNAKSRISYMSSMNENFKCGLLAKASNSNFTIGNFSSFNSLNSVMSPLNNTTLRNSGVNIF